MNILAIETSCDETAAAVVKDGVYELASVIASSKELHEATGGVVPEIAARKQIEFIVPVIEQTLMKLHEALDLKEEFSPEKRAASTHPFLRKCADHIDAIAVTVGPGLIGSLLVGVEAAKALSLAWNKPLIPVNHLVGHIYANFLQPERATYSHPFLEGKGIKFPFVSLVISGGHTDLVLLRNHGDMEYLGGTLDDAAGEAFDKTARLLGLAKYLGGAELSRLAATNTFVPEHDLLPRPMMDQDNFDFSFSGLKTAVKNLVQKDTYSKETVAYEFEKAVTDVVVKKTIRAGLKYDVKQILVGGGVAANTYLRTRLTEAANEKGIKLVVPPFRLCTDNAIYIAAAAHFNPQYKPLDEINANSSLGIMDLV